MSESRRYRTWKSSSIKLKWNWTSIGQKKVIMMSVFWKMQSQNSKHWMWTIWRNLQRRAIEELTHSEITTVQPLPKDFSVVLGRNSALSQQKSTKKITLIPHNSMRVTFSPKCTSLATNRNSILRPKGFLVWKITMHLYPLTISVSKEPLIDALSMK